MRNLTYVEAIREAHAQLMAADDNVFVIGQGLWSPWYVGASMLNLEKEFGKDRVIDCPVSENATTGAAIGAAISGMRPIIVHPRMDFMVLALDPIMNQAANWSYMFAGKSGVPVVIRAIINRGGEQGAQHSQALQSFFMHIPGVKVVMPSTPYDAKGLLVAAVRDNNPVVYIDDRWLYEESGDVPEETYEVPIGEGAVRREGADITLVGTSQLSIESEKAAEELAKQDINAEVIDLRSIKPWDRELVLTSVRKTGRLVVADGGWRMGGVAAEIVATIAEEAHGDLRAPIRRVCLPDAPAPVSSSLEEGYYPRARDIVRAAVRTVSVKTPLA